jgi:Nif-specific regulatory protein
MLANQPRQARLRPAWIDPSGPIVEGFCAVSSALAASSPPASLEDALDALSKSLELRGASLALFDDDGPPDVVVDSWSPERSSPGLLALAREAARHVRATQMPLVVENAWVELAAADALGTSWHEGDLDASLVGVPVKSEGRTIGSLAIVREHSAGDQAAFCFDADVTLLGGVANLVGLALRIGRLRARADRAIDRPAPLLEGGFSEGSDDPPAVATGAAPGLGAALRKAERAAKTNATVLIRGETGVGKNLIARAVHEASPRRAGPFVVLNCGALSETLLESELFGHEKGAFTGALGQRKGRFELADGGTLFLDEIGEISPSFQAKLLRVLQEGEFERVGGTSTLSVDVRIIAATHRDLEGAVRAGTFRADLYYRLCVVPIRVPALRERPEDIVPLARHFLAAFNAENGTSRALAASALALLVRHPFPGNVRELENAVRRAASLTDHPALTADHFSFLREDAALRDRALPVNAPDSAPPRPFETRPIERPSVEGGRLVERERLLEALERTGWVLAKAARILDLTPRQVGYAVHRYGIAVHKF